VYTLGVSPAHDSSVCLLEGPKVSRFYKEERITKKKRASNPLKATFKILEGVQYLDAFAFCPPYTSAGREWLNIVEKATSVKQSLDLSDAHHLQHASLAFYNSGFKEAAVIVVDREGSFLPPKYRGLDDRGSASECESIFYATYPNEFLPMYKNYSMNSNWAYRAVEDLRKENPTCEYECRTMFGVTKVYESATSLIMQNALENGKTMGLSAYGNKNASFPNLFVNTTNIPVDYYFCNQDVFDDYEVVPTELARHKTNILNVDDVSLFADYAWQVQKQTQDAICFLIKKAIDKTGLKEVCVTGGYGLNVVANAYYLKVFPDVKFYFEPLADDSGNSMGGAMYAYRSITKDMEIHPLQTTFVHGEEHPLTSVSGEEASVSDVAELILAQKSVAVYYGKSESGPRALGHRSILFDATNPNAKDLINKVKNREWYRPFAAMCLREDAEKYFELNDYTNSRYMTVNFDAKDIALKEIPGVLHVDNTCRIQLIEDESEPCYQLLVELKKRTGVGVVLNTSFNLAGKPLVETPEDAIWTLNNSELDAVWFPAIETIQV
jgi:carbamoyltransferase